MKHWLILLFLASIQLATAQDTITVNIDFGDNLSPVPWNNLSRARTGVLDQLIDDEGFSTSIQLQVDDAFNGINNSGTTMPAPELALPGTASGDSFFGNRDSFSNVIETTGGVLISGLDTSLRYDLFLFASRLASDNRETQYNISSDSQDTLFLQVANNLDTWASLQQVRPRPDGTIHIQATTGPNNTNTFGFFYLGALRLQYVSDRPNVPKSLRLTAPDGGEYWQPGQQPEIRWTSTGNPMVQIDYSTDGGQNWVSLDTVPGVQQAYPWTIPNLPSNQCLVRISADTLMAQSKNNFTIATEDTASCQIVVLGSSTAAGTGPTVKDSAWVWKYRDYLFQKDTRFRVINLAKGGFTTYNILPTGASIPAGIDQTIDTARNVSKAMQSAPDGIIINLPSNDAARGYPVEDQLENYNQILALPYADSIPVWICTPQPRNFSNSSVAIQLALLDSTFTRFSDFAIDFWNGFADSTQRINPIFDSGDGVHLNNEGHRLLLERILGAKIDSFLLSVKTPDIISSQQQIADAPFQLSLFPNPAPSQLNIEYHLPESDRVRLNILNTSGQVVRQVTTPQQLPGEQQLQLPVSNLSPGVYFCCLDLVEQQQRRIKRFIISPR